MAEYVTIIAGVFAVGAACGGLLTRWWTTRRRRSALRKFAALRRTGTELRNRGLLLTNDERLAAWVEERDVWHRTAWAMVREIADHEADAFETLGNFEDRDMISNPSGYFSSEHIRHVAFLTADIRRLDEIRQRYS